MAAVDVCLKVATGLIGNCSRDDWSARAPRRLRGVPVIGLEPGDFVEYRARRDNVVGWLECLSSERDSACSKEDQPSIEVRQGHERRPRKIEILGLIEPTTQGEDTLGDRVELVVGRVFRPHREDVDAR